MRKWLLLFLALLVFSNAVGLYWNFHHQEKPIEASSHVEHQAINYYHHHTRSNDHGHAKKIWVSFMAAGWNNQRQGLMAAAYIAHYLNRTLVLPRTFHPNAHNGKALPIDQLLNLTHMSQVMDINWQWGKIADLPVGSPRFGISGRCQSELTPSVLRQRLSRFENESDIDFWVPWMDLHSNFVYDESSIGWRKFWGAFQPTNIYESCAKKVVGILVKDDDSDSSMNGRAPCTKLHGTHMRMGDRQGYPLFNCTEGQSTFGRPLAVISPDLDPLVDLPCVWQEDGNKKEPLTMQKVIETAVLEKPSDWKSNNVASTACLYVATNRDDDPRNKALKDSMEKQGIRVFYYKDIIWQLPQDCHALDASFLEMAIVNRIPGRFFPSFPSSWDDFVLNRRAIAQIHPMAIPDEALNKARRRAQVHRWNLNGKPKYCIFDVTTRVMPNYKLQQEVDLLKRKVNELEKLTKAQTKLLEQYSK